jgi:hypothetical protein
MVFEGYKQRKAVNYRPFFLVQEFENPYECNDSIYMKKVRDRDRAC